MSFGVDAFLLSPTSRLARRLGGDRPRAAADPGAPRLSPGPADHAEGDVWIHTRRVCEELAALDDFRALPGEDREILFWAALLHDVTKPACTRRTSDGRIRSPGHAARGAVLARRLLWRSGLPFAEREQVAGMVLLHALPLWAAERDDGARSLCLGERRAGGAVGQLEVGDQGRQVGSGSQHHHPQLLDRYRTLALDVVDLHRPWAYGAPRRCRRG